MKLDRKQQQYAALAIGGVVVAGLFVTVFGVLGPKNVTDNPFADVPQAIDTTIVADKTSAAAPEMSWVTTSRQKIEDLEKLVDDMKKSAEAEKESNAKFLETMRAEYDEMLVQQADKIAALQSGVPAGGPVGPNGAQGPELSGFPDYSATGSEFIEGRTKGGANGGAQIRPTAPGGSQKEQRQNALDAAAVQDGAGVNGSSVGFGQSFSLTAVTAEDGKIARNRLKDYIPAGSYAPAVVLSGADAATNVSDRENPIPVLFRITGPAVTAARGSGKGARVNITGCTVQGSAIGDLSSERVKVRLISMTCINGRGEVLETEVSGYMVGSGKAGVRGQVVSREGKLVSNAMIAGALQGLAGAAQSSTGNTAGSANTNVDVAEIAKNAAAAAGASGVQTAATTLSEYYINRAEQYQPVISLNGGTDVELVFLEGVKF